MDVEKLYVLMVAGIDEPDDELFYEQLTSFPAALLTEEYPQFQSIKGKRVTTPLVRTVFNLSLTQEVDFDVCIELYEYTATYKDDYPHRISELKEVLLQYVQETLFSSEDTHVALLVAFHRSDTIIEMYKAVEETERAITITEDHPTMVGIFHSIFDDAGGDEMDPAKKAKLLLTRSLLKTNMYNATF